MHGNDPVVAVKPGAFALIRKFKTVASGYFNSFFYNIHIRSYLEMTTPGLHEGCPGADIVCREDQRPELCTLSRRYELNSLASSSFSMDMCMR